MATHVLQNVAEQGAQQVSRANSTIDNPLANKKARVGAGAALGAIVVETPVSYTHLTLPTNREV